MFRPTLFLSLLLLSASLSATCDPAITLEVSRPIDTEAEPTVVFARATSGCPVTAMRVYSDYKLVYEQHNQATINARLILGAGTHRVGIQAWNSAGALAKDERWIVSTGDSVEPPAGCELAGVSGAVYSGDHIPNDSQSPVWMGMIAAGSAPIRSMRLYVDGVDRAQTWRTSGYCLPVALISLKPGYHFLTVQAWDTLGFIYMTGSIVHVVP